MKVFVIMLGVVPKVLWASFFISVKEETFSKKTVVGIVSALLLISVFSLAFNIQPAQSAAQTIIVPDDYPTIQAAINAANAGDTIFVRNGSYGPTYVNKAVTRWRKQKINLYHG